MRSTATGYAWRSYAPTPEAVTVTCSVSGAELGDAVPVADGVEDGEWLGLAEEEWPPVAEHAVSATETKAAVSMRTTHPILGTLPAAGRRSRPRRWAAVPLVAVETLCGRRSSALLRPPRWNELPSSP